VLALGLAISLSAIILMIFGLIMPKTTAKGAETIWRIKGFRLYMKTAEKDRQIFYEKENIFEKYLPYAIIFNMVNLWAKKMEQIYGKEYATNYHPVWFVGSASAINFSEIDKSISQLASSMNEAISPGSSSGGGGGGFSGGGGGGGGGGGW